MTVTSMKNVHIEKMTDPSLIASWVMWIAYGLSVLIAVGCLSIMLAYLDIPMKLVVLSAGVKSGYDLTPWGDNLYRKC